MEAEAEVSYRIREVAERVNVPEGFVRRLIAVGALPGEEAPRSTSATMVSTANPAACQECSSRVRRTSRGPSLPRTAVLAGVDMVRRAPASTCRRPTWASTPVR
jgi:hypothetical protein